jgi:hypothetical protein
VLRTVVVAVVGLGSPAIAVSGLPSASAAPAGPALSVDTSADRHRISADVYGMNDAPPGLVSELALTADRWGGNSTSRYNYRNNTTNLASDWYFENVQTDVSLSTVVRRDLNAHAQPIITVPMLGWVARKSPASHPFRCGFKVSKYGGQQDTDPYDPDCGNGVRPGGSPITGNAPADTSVKAGKHFQKAMIRHLVASFGKAKKGGVKTYELDNEPALWNSTHRDVHPKALTYDELWSRSKRTAAAMKAVDPKAKVDGPGDWGWCAYFFSPADPDGCSPGSDRHSHGDLSMAPWYLKKFADYQKATGKRLLDFFDEHYYPQADGVSLQPAGSAATQALRLRSTRTLWDPSYTDESWTTDLGIGPVALIPRMRGWVQKYYPGTKIAITEYNWGGLESINGALAQADVLGIFGRERVDRALLWSPPDAGQPGAFAFRMYRNFDGAGGRFGDVGVSAISEDQDRLAVYAAQRSSDGATTVMVVNKTKQDLTSTLALAGATASSARVFSYSSQDLNRIVSGPAETVSGGAISHTYPASSITLFVLP